MNCIKTEVARAATSTAVARPDVASRPGLAVEPARSLESQEPAQVPVKRAHIPSLSQAVPEDNARRAKVARVAAGTTGARTHGGQPGDVSVLQPHENQKEAA